MTALINTTETQNQSQLVKNLKLLLKTRGISARQVSSDLEEKIKPMQLSRILSGVTKNPGIEAMTYLSNYFNVPIDDLIKSDLTQSNTTKHKKRIYHLPILSIENLTKIDSIDDLDLTGWQHWQTLSPISDSKFSEQSFVLKTTDRQHPRFPEGTCLVFDPNEEPIHDDLVLVKTIQTNKVELRTLRIDPPVLECQSLFSQSNYFQFDLSKHRILGINVSILFSNRK